MNSCDTCSLPIFNRFGLEPRSDGRQSRPHFGHPECTLRPDEKST